MVTLEGKKERWRQDADLPRHKRKKEYHAGSVSLYHLRRRGHLDPKYSVSQKRKEKERSAWKTPSKARIPDTSAYISKQRGQVPQPSVRDETS